jgi:hypothetical protein
MARMTNVADTTESLLVRTKNLLSQRGNLTLREISVATDVGYEWLRSLRYRPIEQLNPGVVQVERVYRFLVEYHAAQRFQQRQAEARTS